MPLAFEWYQSGKAVPLEKPHKEDPWVRIIDAAPPEDALQKGGESTHQKRWRHHPRHARVRSDGSVDLDPASAGAGATAAASAGSSDSAEASREHAALLEERLEKVMHRASRILRLPPSPPLRGADDEASVPGVAAAAAAAKAAEMMKATAGNGNGSATDGGAAAEGKGGATAVAEGKAAYDDEDELRHYFRQVDRATSVNGSSSSSHGNRTGTGPFHPHVVWREMRGRPLGGFRGTGGPPSRLWRVVPGGVHDIIEGSGENRTVFSVEGIHPPALMNGSYLVDTTGSLEPDVVHYLNRNLTWVDRLTPFRAVLLVLPRQPREWQARRVYAAQLLRSWYGTSRWIDRIVLVVMSLDGLVEIAVGHQAKIVLSDAVARHFSIKAAELMAQPYTEEQQARSHARGRRLEVDRLAEVAQKLIFYVSFTVRSRTQATAMSMRSMSMFMMVSTLHVTRTCACVPPCHQSAHTILYVCRESMHKPAIAHALLHADHNGHRRRDLRGSVTHRFGPAHCPHRCS